jgi:cyclase
MHNHALPHSHRQSRRDFLRRMMGGPLVGASILELAWHRAAWARALAPTAGPKLFDIERVADGVYFALARPQAKINANATIFVNSADAVVVDAHSKPSAAASLIAQIKNEITPNPVRYVVNTHFHWDHTQGNHAYRVAENKIDFIASAPTKKLMADLAQRRLQASLDEIPKQIDALRTRAGRSSSAAEKSFCQEQIRQLEAYQAEMKTFTLELPTITFDKSHLIRDRAHDLQVEFRGHAHTAGDVVVFCPQKRVVATGDMLHGFLPFLTDGFPKSWPKTLDSVAQFEFDKVCPGHGPVQPRQERLINMRNYLEELVEKVEAGKKAGKPVAELQKMITVASMKSLQANGYAKYISDNQYKFNPNFGPTAPLQNDLNTNILDAYNNLGRV